MEAAITVAKSWTLVRRNLDWRPRTPTKLHPYRRRGLLHHRAIPRISNGYRVRLVELHDARKDPVHFGAALAPGVKHSVTADQGRFVIDAIDFPDAERITAEQLASSAQGLCWLHVWPELTIAPSVRDQVVEILKKWRFDQEPPPALIIAGSCHEKVGDEVFNRATLLDSRGSQLAQQGKIVPYSAKDEEGNHEEEAISPATEIIILISSGPAVAIGICRDFCDLNHAGGLYLGLDVDLVVVPSMGGLTTTQSHLIAAKGLRTETGTVAFVVQQADPKKAQVHYVVRPDSTYDAAMAEVSESWTCHAWT
ncbi:hypothetical protein BOSE62_71326 [Bosea sp. 62]|nr:hypothetical protein BOSE21B_90304 [Bosea sp. 21B]CAD5295478.1 hypothetical protein BOSE46_80397 [Bosea sp. 46]CAD5298361.1 hypothetical protein BOSE7B_60361 [Bosea sp. 7B]VVT60949.1 hypothetical protein BOS5A_230226 [Bosea sp. EC-HK365B]VXB35145.1 hypothetical protein BOSE127_110360 [Bosea sp. 127]VXB58394.1 hypothetical protein BOSE125_131144 [Bosea sp. 125]VXC76662.1 hypothetical protein BOSE29B_80287 [Bosea sp. 29B]VXC90080.1 hypothetical protein BOSE62_71326 [Bosea sp. 62]